MLRPFGKPELIEAVEVMEVYCMPGWVPEGRLFAAVKTVVQHFKKQSLGVRQHTGFDKSIVYFVVLNGSRVSGDFSSPDDAKKRARELFDVLGFATWANPSETMD